MFESMRIRKLVKRRDIMTKTNAAAPIPEMKNASIDSGGQRLATFARVFRGWTKKCRPSTDRNLHILHITLRRIFVWGLVIADEASAASAGSSNACQSQYYAVVSNETYL